MNYPDFQIDWLRAFVAVVDAGSLSGAAPLVHRSQSAVSMQIKKLEAALDRPVLLRGPRHLEVTPAGAQLLSYARRVLDLQAEAHAALFGPKLAGRVRLGVPDDYASTYLTPVLRSFSHRYQGVEIELTCEQSTSLIPRVVRGELDLALVSRDKPQRGRFLFDEPLVWVGAAQYEAWRRDPLPIAVYESTSMARQATLSALAARRRGGVPTASCTTAPAWRASWPLWKAAWRWPCSRAAACRPICRSCKTCQRSLTCRHSMRCTWQCCAARCRSARQRWTRCMSRWCVRWARRRGRMRPCAPPLRPCAVCPDPVVGLAATAPWLRQAQPERLGA